MDKLIPYLDYKDSGSVWLGEIPKHWKLKRLKYVFKINKRPAGQLGYSVLSITQKGIIVKDIESGNGQLAMDYSKYQLIYPGDFAMNHMDLITGYVDISKFEGVISPDYRVFSLIDNESEKEFLVKTLQLCYRRKIFFTYGQGVSLLGRWRLSADSFNNFIFPIPLKHEQRAIGDFLNEKISKIDRLLYKKKLLLHLLNERIITLIQKDDAPTDSPKSAFWPTINPTWKIEKAKRIFSEINIKSHGSEELLAVTQNRGVLPKALCDQDFVQPTTGIEGQKLVESGDFVISLRSFQGGIEFSYYRGIVSPAYTIIRLKPEFQDIRYVQFYRYLFKSRQFIGELNTAISGIRDGKNVNWSDFSELVIPVPNLEHLDGLLEMVEAFEKQKEIFNREQKLVLEYRNRLMSDVLTGKIDVRNYTIPKDATLPSEISQDQFDVDAEDETEFETQENEE